MKGVKGSSFGVRFYRRGNAKIDVRDTGSPEAANAESDVIPNVEMEITTTMTDIPPQTDKVVLNNAQASVKVTPPEKTKEAAQKDMRERALWTAAKAGDCGRIRVLVMEGVDLESRDSEGRTAINIATQYNQRDALKTLLAAKEMRRMAKLGELPQTKFFSKFSKTGTENR